MDRTHGWGSAEVDYTNPLPPILTVSPTALTTSSQTLKITFPPAGCPRCNRLLTSSAADVTAPEDDAELTTDPAPALTLSAIALLRRLRRRIRKDTRGRTTTKKIKVSALDLVIPLENWDQSNHERMIVRVEGALGVVEVVDGG